MSKQFGAIYLILGTCIAAGMLGLPVVTASTQFTLTTIMILSAWLLMTAGAYCLLQVNLIMPKGANIMSMAERAFGKSTKGITAIIYLLQLYSLICAYLAASSDLVNAFFKGIHLHAPEAISTIIATIILGSIVHRGISAVDFFNRGLMSTKIVICLFVIIAMLPFMHTAPLHTGQWIWHGSTFMVMITAFGYASILPSIRDYLNNDKKQLTRAVLIGSCAPVILYLIWIAVTQGVLPHDGPNGLIAMNNAPNTNSMLMQQIAIITHHQPIKTLSMVFIAICSITGFLSVSLSLTDVLADGLKRDKKGWQKIGTTMLALLPPMLIVIFDPAIFTRALAYAGVCCLYILAILPIAMFFRLKLAHGKQFL